MSLYQDRKASMNQKVRINYRLFNIISISILAFFSTQFIHELMHLVVAQFLGYHASGFHLFAVNIDFTSSSQGIWGIVLVESLASITNILICLLAVSLFYFLNHGYLKLSAMMIAGFQGMMGFGYMLFDGLFYVPGAVGDWKSVLDMFEGNIILRVSIILIGAIGYMSLFFWLGKASLAFLASHQRSLDKQRARLGLEILVLPYVLSILFNVPLSFWHPLGVSIGFFVVFFQYVFGYSGFLTGFFMLWKWLEPKTLSSSGTIILSTEPAFLAWLFSGVAIVLQFYLVFATTV